MMADRRGHHSPRGHTESRKEPRHSDREHHDARRMRPAPTDYLSSSSSSTSSMELVDISRTFPSSRSGIRSFFTAPSERRRLRRRRSSRLFKLNNSSSSSINSDLAYGTGYIKRSKLRRVRSRTGKDIDREKYSDKEGGKHRGSDRDRLSGSERRGKTEAEILAVGAGLAKLARDQNKLDLKNSRNGKRPEVVGGIDIGHQNYGGSRGLAPSKISHGSDTFDEDGWESASDNESDASVDSRLAFGDNNNKGGWGFWGKKSVRPLSRKDTIVDPRLFGPENSLHGFVDEPVGFGEVSPWHSTSNFGPRDNSSIVGPNESFNGSQASLQRVYPVQGADPSRFDAARSSVVSGSEPYITARPDPIPLQHPQPYTPVSQNIYEPTYPAPSEPRREASSSSRNHSIAKTALVGVAGAAAIGAAAIASDRKDDRAERRREDDRDEGRLRRRDSDKKGSKDGHRRDKRDSPDRDERREKRRDKERKSEDSRYSDEQRKEKKRDKRRGETRDGDRDERREKRREERQEDRRGDRSETTIRPDPRYDDKRSSYEATVPTTSSVAPIYQVGDRAPKEDPSRGHHRVASVPTVVTVDREPDFTHKRKSSIKEQPSTYRSDYQKDYSEVDDGGNRTLHEAEDIYRETEHSTAPIVASAIAAATAATAAQSYRESRSDKRRDERRSERTSDYDYEDPDHKPRGREPVRERDPIQEEADRAYREIIMARKVASQVIRSRSASPDPSVTSKHNQHEEDVPQIVTPPEMEHEKKKGPYDAPNADFQPDYILENPGQLRTFDLPSIGVSRSNPEGGFSTRDPDTSKPRPLLNLVRPTPVPSPLPEKQAARSERGPSESDDRKHNRSEPVESSKSQESQARDEKFDSSVPDVVIGPRGNVISSPTSSTVSKGVTWGENVTKHYDVESPSDYREEYLSKSEIRSHDSSPEVKPQSKPSASKGWGAIAAGIIGGGAVAAASSSETSKRAKDDERERSQAEPYEHRRVGAETDSPPAKGRRRRSPPFSDSESSSTQPSRVPGAFDDDLDFTATVAAGLQDTGFDPNIVIDDPNFRRRDSPPGTNESGSYRRAFAETVSDLGQIPLSSSGGAGSSQDYVIEDADSTPRDWRSVSPDLGQTPTKLSKKEQKKRDKAAKRQSVDVIPSDLAQTSIESEPEAYFDAPKLSKKEQKKRDKEAKRQSLETEEIVAPSVAREFVAEPESYIEGSKKSKKKSKRDSKAFDDDVGSPSAASRDERIISVPVDAFDDVRNEDDEWNESRKSKKKSKRDSDRYDSPSRSTVSEVASERDRSFKTDPTEVSLPASTPSETSQDRDFDDSWKPRKSLLRDSVDFDPNYDDDSRSAVSEATSRYDDPRKSKKKSRSSTKDDFDDTRSVASASSAPAGDESSRKSKKKEKEKKSSGFFGMFGSKSESGAGEESHKGSRDDYEDVKKKSKKSKRSSLPDSSHLDGDMGADSVSDVSRSVSSGHSSRRYDDDQDDGGYSNTERKKTRSRTGSASSKKDSFLGNAGTLGAGVGLAGAAVAIAAHSHRQSKAARAYDEAVLPDHSERIESSLERGEIFDPEITQRDFRPSIDPQYGDLLPLPPSDPISPDNEPLDDLPDLPESRPETPDAERLTKEKARSTFRKNLQETPIKSPSHSAVPLKFLLGNRSTPSSPGLVRSSPMQSPATPNPESLTFPKSNRSRPKSWDNGKEYRPLWLPESSLHGSGTQANDSDDPLPALPLSQTTSRSSSQLDFEDLAHARDLEQSRSDRIGRPNEGLSIDIELASSKPTAELLDSQQSTPKATVSFDNLEQHDMSSNESEYADALSLPTDSPIQSSPPTSRRETQAPSGISSEAIAGVALASTIGYLASSSSRQKPEETDPEALPSLQEQPAPAEPMSKDRSSYLLRSSPMSRNNDSTEPRRDIDSPSRRKLSHTEEEGLDSMGQEIDLSKSLEEDRERTLEILSGLPYDETLKQQITDAELGEQRDIGGMPQGETDPADEFVLKTSKKDKKKRKEPSRLSAQNDLALPETSSDIPREISRQTDAETEEFSLTKSKKDKKKDKKKNKSAVPWDIDEEEKPLQQDEESMVEAIPSVPESASTFPEEISTPTKKGKKKDKKAKSKMSQEPEFQEEDASQLPEEPLPEPSREIVAETSSTAEPEAEAVAEVAFLKSKKDKKKNKKGKSKMAWEPEPELEPEAASQVAEEFMHELSQDTIAEQAHTESEIVDQKYSSEPQVSWGADEKGVLQEVEPPLSLEAPPPDSLGGFETKKGKKKNKRKSVTLLEPREEDDDSKLSSAGFQPGDSTYQEAPGNSDIEASVAMREPPQTIPVDESLTAEKELPQPTSETSQDADEPPPEEDPSNTVEEPVRESKKAKKKKGKGAMKWGPEEEPAEALPPKEDVGFEEFVIPASKKGKKKGKKSQSFTPEEPFASEPAIEESTETTIEPTLHKETATDLTEPSKAAEEEFEAFVTTSSKKGKKKSKKSKALDLEPEQTPRDTLDGAEARDIEPTQEPGISDRFTAPYSTKDDKSASATAVFSAAAAATGAALLATHELEKGHRLKDLAPDEHEAIESLTVDESRPTPLEFSTNPSKPDGLDAGYAEDQLTLARQLQEEFGSGSKKSKKDKKKRQSLPATPDPESSRSRPAHELTDLHPRARSLSTGPAAENDTPKNQYSEDQLDLARQLKAEFEKGSKKSKKSKKGRQEFSEPAAWGDDFPDQPTQETESRGAETLVDDPKLDTAEDTTKGDGFTAGYQEDQLSLARQLQAEFGKKSKKDKKRKSTSQTRQVEEQGNDYFGDQSQSVVPEESPMENPAEPPETRTNEGEISRDGLAAGYKEDQLELARQLKEEFGSGSKKSKKDKKGKKNEKLGRTLTYDESLTGTSTGEPQEPAEAEVSQLQQTATEDSTIVPTVTEPENEFAFTTKKSKKDKKGKKRQSLPLTAIDDDLSSQIPSTGADNPVDNEASQPEPFEAAFEPITAPVKKSKKDKGKKRDIVSAATDDNISSEVTAEATEDSLDTNTPETNTLQQPATEPGAEANESAPASKSLPETDPIPSIDELAFENVNPDDEFEVLTKKSKKDKKSKKRLSLYGANDEAITSSVPTTDAEASRGVDVSQPEVIQPLSEVVTTESTADFEFTTKKSKKDKKSKKRDSLLPATLPEDNSAVSNNKELEGPLDPSIPLESYSTPEETASAPAADEFTMPSKKSKKDKKKRQSVAAQDDVTPATEWQEDSSPAPIVASEELSTPEPPAATLATEAAGEAPEDFTLGSKKSKKNKKNRQSLLRASTADSLPDEIVEGQELQSSSGDHTANTGEDATTLQFNEPEDEYQTFSKKKSKKDKKKRQSIQEASVDDKNVDDLEIPIASQADLVDDEDSQRGLPEPTLAIENPPAADIISRDQAADEVPLSNRSSAETPDEAPENVLEQLHSTKKPKSDKNKGKDSSRSDAETTLGEFAALDLDNEPKNETTESSLPADSAPRDIVAVVEPEQVDTALDMEGTGVWDAFTTKKSKKGKKKRKDTASDSVELAETPTSLGAALEPSTDINEPVLQPDMEVGVDEPSKEGLHKEARDTTQDIAEEPVQDDWTPLTSKKSKKEKKRKSDMSTPIEKIPEASVPVEEPLGLDALSSSAAPKDTEEIPATQDSSTSTITQEASQDPAPDEWGFSSKKSKKDKKKRKSGFSTPAENIPEDVKTFEEPKKVSEQAPAITAKDFVEEPSQIEDPPAADTLGSAKDMGDDEWTVPLKQSKKDKKKRKSGTSTPIQSVPEEATSAQEITDSAEPSATIVSTHLVEEPVQIEDPLTSDAQEPIKETLDDEWAVTTKKSKKDKKRKSGLSAPIEGALEQPKDLEVPTELEQSAIVIATEGAPEELAVSSPPAAGDDEWAATTSKKSKKDKKKRKSGLSTPIEVPEEPEPLPEPTEQDIPAIVPQEATAGPVEQKEFAPEDVTQEPVDDEWASIPSKKSKKDKKKRKSGISSPGEEAIDKPKAAEDYSKEEILAIVSKEKTQELSAIEESAADSTKEVFETIEASAEPRELLPMAEPSSIATDITARPLEETSNAPDPTETPVAEPSQVEEPVDEWASYSTKKSKKGKKKEKKLSKYEVSASIDDVLEKTATTEGPPDSPSAPEPKTEIVTEIPSSEHPTSAPPSHDLAEPTAGEQLASTTAPEVASRDLEDEWAPISSKKTKKDKKNRKSGLSTPAREEALAGSPNPQKTKTGGSRELDFQQLSTEFSQPQPDIPETLLANEEENNEAADDGFGFATKKSKKEKKKGKRASRTDSVDQIEETSPAGASTETETTTTTTREVADNLTQGQDTSTTDKVQAKSADPIAEAAKSDNTELFASELARKGSKKDKRKRQATVDPTITGDAQSAKVPLTTWAYEVEEAEVERELPVIKDIAKDGSLSHIASTTEAEPMDDFIRPNKKGKKGTKRNSALLDSEHMEDSSHSLGEGETPLTKSQKDRDVPALATAGAVLAGAVLLNRASDTQTIPKSPSDRSSIAIEPVKEPEQTLPKKKQSKKEKRKMSIDRRTPRDDMFDDPALWEGADPKEFAETKDIQDDSGGDGFWSAPSEENKSDDLATTSQEPTRSTESAVHYHEKHPTITSPTSEAKEILVQSSIELNPSSSHSTITGPPSASPLETHITKSSFIKEAPPAISQYISSPSIGDDQDGQERGIAFEGTPVDHNLFRSSKFGRSGFSDLPVVAEENPTEIEEHYPIARHHDTHEPSRDSGFVTESPIPHQGAFTNDYEHTRDSGVHLRDASPSDRTATHISAADAAMASLSWPPVDEERETVDLHKQHSKKTEDPKKKSRHGKTEQESYESHRPEGDRVADFFRVERSQEARPVKQHHEEISSVGLVSSQRAKHEKQSEPHRTSTNDKPSEDKPHRHHGEIISSRDLLPSQNANAEKHVDLHRSQTIHRSSEDKQGSHHDTKTTSRVISPLQRAKEDRYSDAHRGDITREPPKPTQESLVKKRLQRFESPEASQASKPREEAIVNQRVQRVQSPRFHESTRTKEEKYGELNRSQTPKAERPTAFNDNTIAGAAALAGAATLGFAAARQLSQEKRPSSGQSQRSFSPNINRLRTPDPKRPDSVTGSRSGTPPLRRSDRKISGDLRSLSQRSHVDLAKEAELAAQNSAQATPGTTTTTNPTANEGRVRTKDMADVYDGFGEGRMGSPRSPTRPHSMRRRQSMQVLDLESKVEQLAAENRMLAEAKAQAERTLQSSGHAPSSLVEKDAEIDSLKRTLDWLQNEVTRLTEVNDGLTSANITLGNQQNERYGILEAQHTQATRELVDAREAHNNLSTGMDGIVMAQVQAASQEKDQEIAQLRAELESAKEKIREMQRQILLSKTNEVDFLTVRDEDYFDNSCQQLCQHVQQWVLRFSKFSDMRACRLTSEINNDKTIDRLDNAILDGSDVDSYLADRIKRRDVFMSMTMTMVWEFIFTRYLFGMDREQRQKLKSLEKLLSEVGPPAAVHHWRATTLTLLSKRDAFIQQREQDTQAVVHAILETLSEILPPPSHLEVQIEEQLRRVMTAAVDLSIEMRTQRAEYMMLPPLQPEYDANGDLASKVSFNAALMNERSGDTTSNEELEDQKAVVRIVLFPLVVKKGDDRGEGDEEIVVCPAQVLVAKLKKSVRVFSPEDMAHQNTSRISMQSSMPADYGEEDSNVV